MTIRALDSVLKTSLLNYDPFIVVHLVKFEKPQSVAQYGGKLVGLATDYTYITDSQYDIIYNDGATDIEGTPHATGAGSGQNYRANKLTKLGTINESILAKASNLTMTLDSSSLGASAVVSATFTAAEMATDIDLAAEGFQEGDKILLTGSGNTNTGTYVRIDSFSNEGKTIAFTQISSISANSSAQTYTVSLSSEEINILLADKAGTSYTSYINREVLIYKAHINPDTRAIIGVPFLYFKGITSGASITEKLDSSEVQWTLSSHWGDFLRVTGRLTDDATHRALNTDGSPDLDSVIKPAYASDLGFLHSNAAINAIATYNTKETRYKNVSAGGLKGLFGGKKVKEYEIDVPRTTDLQFNTQAKMLPVVYGVHKIDSFPIFVDTNKNNSAEVYRVDALCEGPIAGVLDIHIEDNTTICIDKADSEARSASADDVEVVCYGRQDRGDTLTHYSANTGSEQSFIYGIGGEIFNFPGGLPLSSLRYFSTAYNSVGTGTANSNSQAATGILHEGSHTITSPITASFTFHSGESNQAADNTLVSMADNKNFKVQNDYYTGNEKYWGPSHQVLDTAYVVGKYTIAEGETTLPEMQFVVRGRDPECYNYDGSYKQDSGQTSASVGTFVLNDVVTLWTTDGNTAIDSGTTYTIIDKWSSYDVNGDSDHRFRLSTAPVLGANTAFYMKKSTSKWYMQTWDHAEDAATVPATLYDAGLTIAAGSNSALKKITLSSPSAGVAFAINHSTAVLGLYNAGNSGLLASSYGDFDYTTNVIDNIAALSVTTGITRVYVKNAIALASSASAVDNYYNGNKITLTDTVGGAVYTQVRTVVDYDGTTKVAMVDDPWDYTNIPTTTSKYSIGSVGDRRVTINPAMQLLDYMTNIRYGKGLDLDKDISIDTWKAAARECDTRSDITIVVPSSNTSIVLDAQWKYPSSGTSQWRGNVSAISDTFSVGGNDYKQITFTNCIGKLGTKWNSWKVFASNELYWNSGSVYLGSGAVIGTAPSSGAQSGVTIGNGSATVAINISLASANGNPIVKKYSVSSANFTASGYSLYDADDVKYWRYLGWDDNAQRNVTRHQMNQVISTKAPLFDNINKMLVQFNGILRYAVGKYELDIKRKKPTLVDAERISADDIVGTIKLTDKGLKNSKNYVSTAILDPHNKFEGRSISFFNSVYLKEDKGIQKKGQFSLPGVTNYYNARFNIKQYLDESRYGLQVQFTMAPRGLLLLAGNIIEFTYPRFGYASKAFRIVNLNFKKDGLVDVTADEHNDDAYVVEAEGVGYGVVEQPEPGPVAGVIPSRPTGLAATQTNQGEVVLTWANTDAFTPSTHYTEIWRNTTNDFTDSGTTLIGTSLTGVYNDPISIGSGLQTRYYWIRYQVKTASQLAGSPHRLVPSIYYPNTSDSGFTGRQGVTGVGLSTNAVRSIKLSPGVTQTFVYQNDGTGIESGYQATTTITSVKTNDAGTVAYVWKKTANDGTVTTISGATGTSYTYTPPSAFTDMPQNIAITMTDTVGSETFTATDSISFSAAKIVVNGDPGGAGDPGLSNRFDIAYFTTIGGAGGTFPSGTVAGGNYVKASRGNTQNFQGTNVVTWAANVTETAVSSTAGDYEITQMSGQNTRVDIAYFTDAAGSSPAWPTGTHAGGNYVKAVRGTKTFQGTNVETWFAPATETAVSTTVGDYEITQLVGDNGFSNRLDIAYGDTSNGSGNSRFASGTGADGNYTVATSIASNLYIGTNTETWVQGATETAVSTTIGDYEWTKIVGDNGVSNRIDLAYSDNSDGTGNTQWATGTKAGGNYVPPSSVSTTLYLGTNIVTWVQGATETAVSNTVGDYEWTKFVGDNAYTINASNGSHGFSAGDTGTVSSVSGFSSIFTVYRGTQVYTYDGSASYDANSYRFGTIGSVTPSSSCVPVNTNGTISISASSGGILTGTSVLQSTFTVPVIDNASGATIAVFKYSLTKSLSGANGTSGVRGGSIYTFEESTAGTNITPTHVLAWVGTLTNAAAVAVAADVIAAASDGYIRQNDRITVTDNSANKAGSRIYTGSAQSSSASVSASDFSSLVVETFDGSVIVNGTLGAEKITANSTYSNNLTIGSTMILNNSGQFYTTNKTSYTDTDNGFFLGYTGGAHKLNIGGASNYIKWTGTGLEIAGEISMVGSSTIAGTAASTVATGAASGATSNQDSTGTIQAGTTATNVGLGNVDNTSDATQQTATLSAATSSDVGLGNVDNTSDSTQQTATLSAATSSDVGLSNVDNTSDSTQQTATLSAATSSDVGLGNVDNTSDATVLGGNLTGDVTGDVGGVAVATVNTYGGIAGGTQTDTNTVTKMNSNGLVVIDGSGVTRVKIGNLSAL